MAKHLTGEDFVDAAQAVENARDAFDRARSHYQRLITEYHQLDPDEKQRVTEEIIAINVER